MLTQKKSVKSVLVVEDEKSLAQAIAIKLTNTGFKVLQASNGEIGLKTALKSHPDLILLDIIMPKMDGITMLKKLRQDGWGKNVEVIILTNLSAATKEKELFNQGVEDYLIKSDWKLDDLVKKIKAKIK